VLVKLKDKDENWNIIVKAKKLKDENDPEKKKIWISRDLVKEERQEYKRVRKELNKRRNNKQRWFITKTKK